MSGDSDKQLLKQLREHSAERQSKPSVHDTSQEKVEPAVLIAISIYIAAFLSLAIFARQHPGNWFVRKFYLDGSGILVAGLVLYGY